LGVALGPPLVGGGAVAHAQTDEDVDQADTYMVACEMMEKQLPPNEAFQGCVLALEACQNRYGEDHAKTRRVATVIARLLDQAGKTAEAAQVREHYLSGASSPQPSSPPEPPEPPDSARGDEIIKLVGEAQVAYKAGKYEEAIRGYERLLTMVAEDNLDDSDEAQFFRDRLASSLGKLLRFGKAEPLLRKNLDQATASGDSRRVASAKQALALHYNTAGQYDRARPLYQQNLREAERREPEGIEVVMALVQLARLGDSEGAHDGATAYAERAYELAKNLPDPTVATLIAQVVLGRIYTTVGRYDDAQPLLESALQLGASDPAMKSALTGLLWTLGWLHRSKGDYAKAEKYWRRQLALEEQAEGPKGAGLSSVLNHLAELYWAWGTKKTEIMRLAHRASAIEDRKFAALLSGGTEAMKVAYVQRYVHGTDRVVTYHLHHARQDPEAARLAMNTVLRRKGRVLDAVVDTMSDLRRRASGDDQSKLEEIRNLRSQFATLSLSGRPEGMSDDELRAKLEEIERKDQQLQGDLGSTSARFRAEQEPVDFEAVRDRIPGNAVLVEIIGYRKFDVAYRRYADAFGPERYAAYVLRKGGLPKAVDLGPASAIDAQVATFRAALSAPTRKDVKTLGRRLYDRVMKPLVPLLGKAEHVLLAPDGMLNLVPFSALVDDQGSYLVERYEFSYLSSGRDLLSLHSSGTPKSPPVIVGNPSFDAESSGPASGDDAHRGLRSVDFSRVRFRALPGTATEVANISEMLDDSKLVTEGNATEAMLKGVEAPVLLHVATHGFFLADLAPSKSTTRGLEVVSEGAPKLHVSDQESPLVRSGLALAGANKHDSSGGEDGVLTALEVTGLNLYGTHLVVLSACETGVGEVRNGDGVYGLRRALVIAGSESQVMSLWKVDDDATRDLMIEFYEALIDEQGRSAALRKVQREMATSSDRSHPYYWASFIVSGRWDPMRFDWDEPETSSGDSGDSGGFDFDWSFEARQFADARLDIVGNYIQPDAHDGTFALGALLEYTELMGDSDDFIGLAADMGVGAGLNTDMHFDMDARVGLGPGFWLGPITVAPYLGLGMDMIGTRPDEETEVVDTFIMDPAFYWYGGGRMRLAIASFALEGYAVRTARGSLMADVATDIPNQTRVVTRAVIQIEDETEISAGFHWTDFDADAVGAVGMGGLISYGFTMDD